jgi:outer membrane protein TolC
MFPLIRAISFLVFLHIASITTVQAAKLDTSISGAILSLTLKDAVVQALESNVAISIEKFSSKIKAEGIIESESEFDLTFGADLSTDEKTKQLASTASSSRNTSETDNLNFDLSLTQKLATGADYELNFTNSRDETNSTSATLNPTYSSELELSLTQPILKDYGVDLNKRNIYIAKNNVAISDLEFKSKVIDIISDVESSYWDLVFSIDDLEVKKKSLERARDLERRVKVQVTVGIMAPIETLQAESEVASREELLLAAQDLIKDNEDNLKNILNIDFESAEGIKSIVPAEHPEVVAEEITIDEAIKKALSQRPDYLAKKRELENQDILVKYRENQIYPSVDLVGSLGLNGLSGEGTGKYQGDYGDSLSDTLSGDYYNWAVGIKLSYPLGNRSAKSQLTASRLEKAQLLLSIKSLEKDIITETRQVIRQIKTDAKRLQASEVAEKLAEEKLKAEEKKFKLGLSTSFNVLEFQEDLAEQQRNELKAIIDFNKSKIRLRQALATTLENHNIKLQEEDF